MQFPNPRVAWFRNSTCVLICSDIEIVVEMEPNILLKSATQGRAGNIIGK